MPVGYLVTTGLMAILVGFAIAPRRRRRPSRSNVSFWLGFLVNELPFIAFYWLVASTALAIGQGDIDTPVGWSAFGLAIVASAGLVVIVRRALQTRPILDEALDQGLGSAWQVRLDPATARRVRQRLPLAQILFAPFVFRRRDVERVANVSYGDAGRRNLLDVYRHRSHPSGGPVLVHLHGGAFRGGKKNRQARPLLYRLASQGWVCISANYRIGPTARFPDYLVDAKKVVAWVRKHGPEYGADPTLVFLAGSSAGAHLAATAALTPNDPAFQPGFEEEDTSVTAAICLGGYFGSVVSDDALPSSPLDYIREKAPPFFVAHGDLDTLVPVSDARAFVERLRGLRETPSCTRSCAALSTRSTSFIRSASRPSSTRSRPSPPG